MYCTKCGKQNPPDANFCNSCGAKLVTQGVGFEQGGDRFFQNANLISLNSTPPASINPENIVMYKLDNMRIIAKLDGQWGDKTFSYLNPQDAINDCNKLFEALKEMTNNKVMQFKSIGGPVVPIYRISKAKPNDWWGPTRIEIDFDNIGTEWFEYTNKNVRDADHMALMNLMQA